MARNHGFLVKFPQVFKNISEVLTAAGLTFKDGQYTCLHINDYIFNFHILVIGQFTGAKGGWVGRVVGGGRRGKMNHLYNLVCVTPSGNIQMENKVF